MFEIKRRGGGEEVVSHKWITNRNRWEEKENFPWSPGKGGGKVYDSPLEQLVGETLRRRSCQKAKRKPYLPHQETKMARGTRTIQKGESRPRYRSREIEVGKRKRRIRLRGKEKV